MEKVVQLTIWSKVGGCVVPLLVIIFSSIEIHILRRVRNKSFYEKILLSLTFCDLLHGIYATLAVPFLSIAKVEIHINYWIVWVFIVSYFMLNTIMHLIILCIDRLWSVAAPLHHRIYASNRKLYMAVILSWFIPTIYPVTHITAVLLQGMNAYQIYIYTRTTMAKCMAHIFIVADVTLVFSYCAIIFVLLKKKSLGKQSRQPAQMQYLNAVILCIGIALVFVTATTPYVVAHLIDWSVPHWLVKFSIILLHLNQLLNSLLYLIQKGRAKRTVHVVVVAKENNCTTRKGPYADTHL